MNIRDALLLIYATVWGVVVIVTVARREPVPAELWGALGVGIGVILALFRDGGHQPKDPP